MLNAGLNLQWCGYSWKKKPKQKKNLFLLFCMGWVTLWDVRFIGSIGYDSNGIGDKIAESILYFAMCHKMYAL